MSPSKSTLPELWSFALLSGAGRGPSRRGEQAVISLRRMTLGSDFRYLMESVAVGDGAPGHSSNLTPCYATSGTPPGVFLGAGLAGFLASLKDQLRGLH